jgi:charged multivesicular body protein 5
MQYDMEELLEQANEVQETLSRSYAVPDEIDEVDLEAGTSYSIPWVPVSAQD